MTERNTRQKQAVYDALKALDHPTATEVFAYLQTVQPTISRGTVFRVLSAMAERDTVKRLQLSKSDVRYDYCTLPHAHACCRSCGAVKDVFFDCPPFGSVRAEGFLIEGYEVEFFGICENCKRNEEK